WRFPLGDKPFHLPDGAVTKMALATRHAGQWRIAALTEAGLRVLTLGTDRQASVIPLPQRQLDLLALSPAGDLLYTTEGNLLRVWQLDDDRALLRETHTLPQRPKSLHLLVGGRSLLIQDGSGVTQWFA
ncbi:phosphate ABC transporter permease, partial [Pantoea agglomerans]|nr:phosphate ABC transporter permease [Pantoea agglomerans]